MGAEVPHHLLRRVGGKGRDERAREAERCPVCDALRLDRGTGLGETKVKE